MNYFDLPSDGTTVQTALGAKKTNGSKNVNKLGDRGFKFGFLGSTYERRKSEHRES